MTENQPLFLSILLPKFREISGIIQSQDVHLHLPTRQHPPEQKASPYISGQIVSSSSPYSASSMSHLAEADLGREFRSSSRRAWTKDMTKEMSASSSDQVGQIVSEIISDKLGRILWDRWSFWDRISRPQTDFELYRIVYGEFLRWDFQGKYHAVSGDRLDFRHIAQMRITQI